MHTCLKLSRTGFMHTLYTVSHMCGIIGYTGQENSVPILLSGLHSLEYRGYDSSGISVFVEGGITTVKAKGKITEVEKLLSEKYFDLSSPCGIGHTRWATHGEPSDTNSHPHATENMSLVHNGIIENYLELKESLIKKGYSFVSETDTEVALKTIDSKYKEVGEPLKAIKLALSEIHGSYAFGIIFKDYPGKIFATKKDNPLIVAVSDTASFIASDMPAVLKYTDTYFRAEEGEIAILDGAKVEFVDLCGNPIEKKLEKVEWTYDQATKGGFPHFMIKEIFEEPDAIHKTVNGRTPGYIPEFDISSLSEERLAKVKKIHIVACGTAMHAGLIGKRMIEKYARIPVNVEIASEFRYNNPILSKDDICIIISQSGETADTLAALRLAKEAGLYVLSVVNVAGSSIARESDGVIYTWAGPEIAVASTKAYIVQNCILNLIAIKLGIATGNLDAETAKGYVKNLVDDLPAAVNKVLEMSEYIKKVCKNYVEDEHLFFIGRGIDYLLSCESSLKLKEVSYIHCESYAAGELKHGTISLVTEGTSVVAFVTSKELYAKTLSNIKEVKARGAHVTIICDEEIEISSEAYDEIIALPHVDGELTAIAAATAFQLIAYHTAVLRGCDVDQPRNLAKSVTVE